HLFGYCNTNLGFQKIQLKVRMANSLHKGFFKTKIAKVTLYCHLRVADQKAKPQKKAKSHEGVSSSVASCCRCNACRSVFARCSKLRACIISMTNKDL